MMPTNLSWRGINRETRRDDRKRATRDSGQILLAMVASVIALCSGGHVENNGKTMSIQEITYDTSGPSCHVCGALMAHTRVMGTWECLSCDATTCIVPVQEKDSAKDPNDGLSGSSPRLGHCGSCVQRHTYDGPCPCNCHVLERLQEKEGNVGEKKHHYISTACHHGKHELCRRVCKYCGVGCACTECSHPEKETA